MSSSVESELRALVRDLIMEVVPEVATFRTTNEVREVKISTDADLAAFVVSVLELARNPSQVKRLTTGDLQFSLAAPVGANHQASTARAAANATEGRAAHTPARSVLQVDKGAVTERMITQAVKEGMDIVLGKGAVLTPLARENARRNNINVERAS